jgi:hypothetical protein
MQQQTRMAFAGGFRAPSPAGRMGKQATVNALVESDLAANRWKLTAQKMQI